MTSASWRVDWEENLLFSPSLLHPCLEESSVVKLLSSFCRVSKNHLYIQRNKKKKTPMVWKCGKDHHFFFFLFSLCFAREWPQRGKTAHKHSRLNHEREVRWHTGQKNGKMGPRDPENGWEIGEVKDEDREVQILYLNWQKTQAHPICALIEETSISMIKSFANWIIVYANA